MITGSFLSTFRGGIPRVDKTKIVASHMPKRFLICDHSGITEDAANQGIAAPHTFPVFSIALVLR